MFELIGIAGITGVLAGSLLLSLFIAQSLVHCVVLVMAQAERRARIRPQSMDERRPSGAHVISGQRPRPARA